MSFILYFIGARIYCVQCTCDCLYCYPGNPNAANNDHAADGGITSIESFFNTDNALAIVLFGIIICLLCCMLCIFGAIICCLMRKKKEKEAKEKAFSDNIVHVRIPSNVSQVGQQMQIANTLSTLAANNGTAAMTGSNNVDGEGLGSGELELAISGPSNNSNNDLINLKLQDQPQIIKIKGKGKELSEGLAIDVEDDIDNNEGRNINETTVINNDNNGRIGGGLEIDGDGDGNGNIALDIDVNKWHLWNANQLMEYLRREMLSSNLPEQECNVFLSDLNEQRIDARMIKAMKEKKEFQEQLRQRMHKHPLGIWMMFQISIDNLQG